MYMSGSRSWVRWSRVGALERPDLWTKHVAVNLAHSAWRRRHVADRAAAMLRATSTLGLERLLEVGSSWAKNAFNRLKESAGRASWSAFRQQVEHLRWVDSLGDRYK